MADDATEERDEQTSIWTRLKLWICWSWTYLWGVWFLFIVFLLWALRSPLKLRENINYSAVVFNSLSPKFYVALTGTSSLISGLILIFEWVYYRRYGQSFIESLSLRYLSSLVGGGDSQSSSPGLECKVWKNPLNLFRGAEYKRYTEAKGDDPLTPFDVSTTLQENQSYFTRDSDEEDANKVNSLMYQAWREPNLDNRLSLAEKALAIDPSCSSALIMLAEEKASTILEVERYLKQALKSAEAQQKKTQQLVRDGHRDLAVDPLQRRESNLCVYIRRRLAMCCRKLGRNKEAVKMMKDLIKEFPMMNVLSIHENLIEALLEMHAYAEVQQVLAKYDDISLPKSATICYTAALMKARTVCEKFSPDVVSQGRGLTPVELTAVEFIHRAVEFNPHVPKYLLEQKSLILPPEHILKRGDSEALAYAFSHLQHWKDIDGALKLLHFTWEGAFRLIPYPLEKGHYFHPYPASTENADKELLPPHHKVSVYPKKELPFFILFTGFLCTFTAGLALMTHQYPELMSRVARVVAGWVYAPITFLLEKMEAILPAQIWHLLTRG